jgi:Zn finger protein HypA/HybF involved in hydrogenase expression
MNKNKYAKIRVECQKCKTQFEIWILQNNASPEMEERIRENFEHFCPVCKSLQSVKKA